MRRSRLTSLLTHRTARDRLLRGARDAARSVGAELWVVGGYVRDAALGRAATDLDLVAGRGAARLVRELQRCWSTRGFRFCKRGVTTWRFVPDARGVDLVDASRRGLERDLRRRDFTVNAVAFDLPAGALRDPLGGLADLRAGRLRMPRADAVRRDPVRALRAARFLAEHVRFRLHAATRQEAARAGPRLAHVPRERVHPELDKMLIAEGPSRGLAALEELGLLDAVLPDLVPLRGCQAGAERPDVWRHTLQAIDRSCRAARLPGGSALRSKDGRRVLRWALLLHDVSKPETLALREDGRPTFHGHEIAGAQRAEALLERLRAPREERRRITRLIRLHLRPSLLADAGAPARGMRRLVREAAEDLPLLVVHSACDALASGAPDAARRWRRLRGVLVDLLRRWDDRRAIALPRLVDGHDAMRVLGVGPGRPVGRVLERLRELQEEGRVTTRQEALEWLRNNRRRNGRRGRI